MGRQKRRIVRCSTSGRQRTLSVPNSSQRAAPSAADARTRVCGTMQRMTHRRVLLVPVLALVAFANPRADIDHDLLDVSVSQLHRFYEAKTYTVTQVVQWHLDRIDR